jgi:hypothetical protein
LSVTTDRQKQQITDIRHQLQEAAKTLVHCNLLVVADKKLRGKKSRKLRKKNKEVKI